MGALAGCRLLMLGACRCFSKWEIIESEQLQGVSPFVQDSW